MKQFTVKDFIAYNNPCFSCKENIHFKVMLVPTRGSSSDVVPLRPTVNKDYTVVDLKTTYTQTLQLWIFHQTNKIIASDPRSLKDFLEDHKLYLNSRCDKCFTVIESHFIEFNLDKSYIKPISIWYENIIVTDEHNMYQMQSSFFEEKSTIVINRMDKATPVSPVTFEVPLLPLYKFDDREHFIHKMKTYLVFS